MRLYVNLLFLLFASLSVDAKDKPTLTILSHSYFSKNYDEKVNYENVFYAIRPALNNEFEVELDSTNHARLIRRLSSTEPACTFNAIKTPKRELSILFSSTPTFMHVQRELFTLKDTFENFPSIASIEQLIGKNYVLGVVGSTSYQQLDTIIEKHKSDVAYIWGENSFKQLGELLINKRVDMIIGYKDTLQMYLSDEQFALIRSHKIKEYPEFINGYFACSKTPEGIRAIELIEQYIHTNNMYIYLNDIHRQSNPKVIADKMMELYDSQYNVRLRLPHNSAKIH